MKISNEWLESENKDLKYYLNISRPHDCNKGVYSKPIIILVEHNEKDQLNADSIAERIKRELNCDVFSGEIYYNSGDEPLIKSSHQY